MSSDEAIQLMVSGKRVKHNYFADNEYIYMIDNNLFDEVGLNLGNVHEFFAVRPLMKDCWSECTYSN